MAGKKGKSGPPRGNLNAAKNILSALTRLQRGKSLPPELNRVTVMANQEANELISDKGGWENMGGAERLMLSNWKSARKAELLIWNELLGRGAVLVKEDGSWDLQPGAQRLAPFLSAQRAALLALGLERRAKPVDLKAYIEALKPGEKTSSETR